MSYVVSEMATVGFAQRLTEARRRAGLTQDEVAALTRKTRQAVSKWERGEAEPSREDLLTLASAFGVSVAYLLGEIDDPTPFDQRAREILEHDALPLVPIPILGVIHAGDAIPAEQYIEGWIAITEERAKRGEHFALRVRGDCFAAGPRPIYDGDVVIVRKQPTAENGEIAVVLWPDSDEAQLRRIYRQDGVVVLRSDNHKYPPEIVKKRQLTILGVVVGFIATPAAARE